MRIGKPAALTFSLVVLTLAAAPFAKTDPHPTTTQQPVTVDTPQSWPSPPEHVVYRMLLHQAHVYEEKAREAESQGRFDAALAYRNVLRQDAELTAEQSAALGRIAAECERDVKAQDKRAGAIISLRRKHYERTGEFLPPSPELASMQEARNAIILGCRNQLRAAFGESEWGRFLRFVQERVAPNVTAEGSQFAAAHASAQAIIHGYTSGSFDRAMNLVIGITTTELDYAAQDWYQARVMGRITADADGSSLAFAAGNDLDRDGTVSFTMQVPGSIDNAYTVKGTHGAIADVRDYAMGAGFYVDYWNYQLYYNGEGDLVRHLYMPFYGYGPRRSITNRNILLGSTFAAVNRVRFKRVCLLSTCRDFNESTRTSIDMSQFADPYCEPAGASNIFTVSIDFELPQHAADFYRDIRTFVNPGSEKDYEFQYVSHDFSNVNMSTTPKRGTINVQVHRMGDGSRAEHNPTKKAVSVTIAGPNHGGTEFSTPAHVTLNCP